MRFSVILSDDPVESRKISGSLDKLSILWGCVNLAVASGSATIFFKVQGCMSPAILGNAEQVDHTWRMAAISPGYCGIVRMDGWSVRRYGLVYALIFFC